MFILSSIPHVELELLALRWRVSHVPYGQSQPVPHTVLLPLKQGPAHSDPALQFPAHVVIIDVSVWSLHKAVTMVLSESTEAAGYMFLRSQSSYFGALFFNIQSS